MKRAALILAVIIIPVAVYAFLHIGKNVDRCHALAAHHARQRDALREELRRIRRELETQKPEQLSDVQKVFNGRSPKECSASGDPGRTAFIARWDIPVGGQSVRIDVKARGCKNDSPVIAFMPISEVDETGLDGCAPEGSRTPRN